MDQRFNDNLGRRSVYLAKFLDTGNSILYFFNNEIFRSSACHIPKYRPFQHLKRLNAYPRGLGSPVINIHCLGS